MPTAEIEKMKMLRKEGNAMKPTVVDHIGIAVNSIRDSLAFWEGTLGIRCTGVEEVAEQKVSSLDRKSVV